VGTMNHVLAAPARAKMMPVVLPLALGLVTGSTAKVKVTDAATVLTGTIQIGTPLDVTSTTFSGKIGVCPDLSSNGAIRVYGKTDGAELLIDNDHAGLVEFIGVVTGTKFRVSGDQSGDTRIGSNNPQIIWTPQSGQIDFGFFKIVGTLSGTVGFRGCMQTPYVDTNVVKLCTDEGTVSTSVCTGWNVTLTPDGALSNCQNPEDTCP